MHCTKICSSFNAYTPSNYYEVNPQYTREQSLYLCIENHFVLAWTLKFTQIGFKFMIMGKFFVI